MFPLRYSASCLAISVLPTVNKTGECYPMLLSNDLLTIQNEILSSFVFQKTKQLPGKVQKLVFLVYLTRVSHQETFC